MRQPLPVVAPAPLPPDGAVFRVRTKVDLLDSDAEQTASGAMDFAVSVVSGAGLDALLAALHRAVVELYGRSEPALITRRRHQEALGDCLKLWRVQPWRACPSEIVAEELRAAGDALARVTGRIDVEDWLDLIFSEFCIGK